MLWYNTIRAGEKQKIRNKRRNKMAKKKRHCRNCFWAAKDLKRHLVCALHHGDIEPRDTPCKDFTWNETSQERITEKARLLNKFNENYSNGIYG